MDTPPLTTRALTPSGQDGRVDFDENFRASLALAFGAFQLSVFSLAGASELAWGTWPLGVLYLLALVPLALLLAWLKRKGSPRTVGTLLVGLVFLVATLTNLLTGGASLGANLALPTVALVAVMFSPPKLAWAWLGMIIAQIGLAAWLRNSGIVFPIRPDPEWVVSAVDRVPLFFVVGSALIGWLVVRALENYRREFDASRLAEADASARAAFNADRLTDFAEIAVDGFWETDSELRLIYVSGSFARAMGMQVDEMLGLTPSEAYRRRFPDSPGVDAYMEPMLRRQEFSDLTFATRDAQNEPRWLQCLGRPVLDRSGDFAGYRGVVRDVTQQLNYEHRIRSNETRLRLITDSVPVQIFHLGPDRRLSFLNRAAERALQVQGRDVVGTHARSAFGPDLFGALSTPLDAAFSGEEVTFEFAHADRHFRATFVPDPSERAGTGVYGLISDISSLKQVEIELRRLAEVDTLTGLANRRRFNLAMQDAIAASRRTGSLLGLMFLDLDRFKQVNDSLGHGVGDELLREFANRLRFSVRPTDTVCRLAGDEFVVILEGLQAPGDAEAVARKVQAAMSPPLVVDGKSLAISSTIGITFHHADEGDSAAMLQRADAALYAAKAAGRGGYQVLP